MKLQKIILIMISLLLILGNAVYAEDALGDETTQEPETSVEEEPREDTTPDDTQNPAQPEDSKQIQWPDFTNAKGQIERTGSQVKIVISGINHTSQKVDYYYALTKDNNVTEVTKLAVKNSDGTLTISGKDLEQIYETNCKIFLTIKLVAYDNSGRQERIMKPVEIERTEQYGIGDRIKIQIMNYINVSINEVMGGSRKLNIKIGSVTDKDLLNSIKNGESNWKQKLLQYSKSATPIYNSTVETSENTSTASVKIDNKTINLNDKQYYYVYLELDNENGKYITVEDVHFTQAYKDKSGVWLTTGFNFNDDGETPAPVVDDNSGNTGSASKDPTTAPGILPKTGEGIAVVVAIIAIIALGIFAKMKYTKYKGI